MQLVNNRRHQQRPFDRAASLGTSCYSAWLLQKLGLRRVAFPFDWIFSTPDMVSHILEDRFLSFLDPAHIRPSLRTERDVAGTSRVCRHSLYHESFGVDWVFNHHDLSIPEIAAAYRRRVDRFVLALADDRKTLLLMINAGAGTTQGSFERLCAAVDAYGRDNTILQIDVVATGDVLDFGMGQAIACGRHRRRLFRSTSEIDGVRFCNPIDDLVMEACIRQYGFSDPQEDGPASRSDAGPLAGFGPADAGSARPRSVSSVRAEP